MTPLRPKDIQETKMLVFAFGDDLGDGEAVINATVDVALLAGADANPQAIKLGLPVISADGRSVYQAITGGVEGADYQLRCLGTTNVDPALTHLASAKLPVRRL